MLDVFITFDNSSLQKFLAYIRHDVNRKIKTKNRQERVKELHNYTKTSQENKKSTISVFLKSPNIYYSCGIFPRDSSKT